jgi:hypothetical protein
MEKNQDKQTEMSLAEAYLRMEEIDKLLDGLRSAVTRVSASKVSAMFNRVGALLGEYESLRRRTKTTEYNTTLNGTPVCDLMVIIDTLEERIKFFSLVSKRTDLSQDTIGLIEVSITKFRSTKEKLLRKHEEAIWEIELLK